MVSGQTHSMPSMGSPLAWAPAPLNDAKACSCWLLMHHEGQLVLALIHTWPVNTRLAHTWHGHA